MKYKRADLILPVELLAEIKKYVPDGLIYVPTGFHKKWGDNTGKREHIINRNMDIKNKFNSNVSLEQLANEYGLSIDTIKKIVYTK